MEIDKEGDGPIEISHRRKSCDGDARLKMLHHQTILVLGPIMSEYIKYSK